MAPPTDARACRRLLLLLPSVSAVNQQNKTTTKWTAATKTPTTDENRRFSNCNCNFQLRLVFWTFAYLPPPPTARTLPVARCCFCFLFAHTSLLFFFLPHTKLCFNTIHTHTLAHTQTKRNRGPNKCKSTLALSFNDWKRNEQKHWLKRHRAQLTTADCKKCCQVSGQAVA